MRILIILSFLTSFGTFSQLVGGDVLKDKRPLLTKTDFKIDGHHDGWVIFTLAIDLEGNVSSAVVKETNLTSRLDCIDIRNYVAKLKFQKGMHYPKFHHVDVKITMVKSENPPELEIIID